MKPIFERVPRSQMESLYCEVVLPSTVPTPWHFHPECQVTLVLNSYGHRVVGDNIASFGPGDLVFIGPNLPHVWQHEGLQRNGDGKAYSIVVQFLDDFLGKEFFARPELEPVQKLVTRGAAALQVNGPTRKEVAERVQSLAQARGLRRIVWLLDILELLAASKTLRPISSPGFQPNLNPFDQARVGKVCAYVNAHLDEPIFRDDLARMLNLSPDAFGRFFRSRTGKTLPAFVNQLRVGRACRLLAETDMAVIEIAMQCGFENLSNFNRQFLHQMRRTPRDYRQTMAKTR
ncbi:MAG: AraC family transcriptional regulator [Verrucomicrobiota bacterium]